MSKAKVIGIIIGGVATFGLMYWMYQTFSKPKNLLGAKSARILFIGDSLTVGFGTNNISYADKLQQKYPSLQIKKIAIVGKQTGWMLTQLKDELSADKYDYVVVWGGVNDIYATNSASQAKANLQNMYDLIKSSGAKVVALTVVPTATYKVSTSQKSDITNYLNDWIKSNKEVDFVIDVNSLISDGNNGTRPEFLQPDGLHLMDSAQSVIADEFSRKVLK